MNDYRSNTIYKNTELVFDGSLIQEAKGTILLIHETAPQNIDGELADYELTSKLKQQEPDHYIVNKTYKDLSRELNELGWNTVRYTRVGVYHNKTVEDEYNKTDLKNIVEQLKAIWKILPNDKPKIAFAWSGGSVHILQLPLEDAAAIIILGGISTKRFNIFKMRAKNEKQLKETENKIDQILSKEGKVSRTEMASVDMPYGRLFDENSLKNNWQYLLPYKQLPTLILHGDADAEVDVSEAYRWKQNLPNHNITMEILKDGNHAFGTKDNKPAMDNLANTINGWLLKSVVNR